MSDLPRLLLCSFDVIPGPSGSSRRLTEYLKALPDRFSVVVLSAKTPDHSHIEKYQGARLLRVPVGSGDLASRIQAFERAVRRQLESEEYALAHFTDPFGGYALCELKAEYGFRLVYEAQGFPSQELRYTHPQLEGDRRFLSKIRRQELFCLMNADLVLTGSSTTRSFIHSLGVGQESVRLVRAPVDLGPYGPESLGEPDGSPMRLMYLGSQVPWQGLAGLLRGLALAVEQVDVRLTVVGPRHPDWQPHLEDLAAELGLQERVEFQPPVPHDDVAKVLALADVGVLPLDDVDRNRLQGGALSKVSEYLAAGRPVLAADLPVTRELVPSSAGVFYPPGDANALAERLVELARDVPRRVTLGRQARAYAEQWLDAGLIRGQLLDIYDALLGKREAPAEGPVEPTHHPTLVTGTPTNRILALEGTVRAAEQKSTPEPPAAEPVQAEAAPPPDSTPDEVNPPHPEELPLVMGQVLENGLDTRLIKTEPDARPDGPPVVMGFPLRESDSAPSPEAPPPPVRQQPPSLPPLPPRARPSRIGLPALPPLLTPVELRAVPPPLSRPTPAPAAPAPAPAPVEPDEPEELDAEEVEEVGDAPTPTHAEPLDEPEEISCEEIEEAEALEDAEPAEPEVPAREPAPSRLNPWFAQLAHGYCPPEGAQFARHTPPTNFPGRDEEPGVPPAPPPQRASRGKPS